jgi:Kelch motif
VLDLTHLSWHTIPSMPCRDRACPRGFGFVSLSSIGSLLVCGGLVSDMDCPLHLVLKYDVYKNKWTVLPPMLSARSFFGGGVIDGRVYVAGGYSTNQFELNSAEVYDPVKGTWDPIASMGIHMAASDSAVIDGKLFVTEGCTWPFFSSPRGRVYNPKSSKWESMAAGMREGWTGLAAVYDKWLFVISEYEGMRLKVYDMESDMWDPVAGPPLPEKVKKPFSVSCLEQQGQIVVVGRGLHVVIGHVERRSDCSKTNCNKSGFMKVSYTIRWEEVEAPREFSDLMPSSCQILFA